MMRMALPALLALGVCAVASERCAVRGTVRNSATGEPVAKATVRLLPEHRRVGYAGVTDEGGNFHFENVEPDDYRIAAEHTGYSADERPARKSLLHLGAESDLTGVDLALTPLGVITGTVVDWDGEPLQGAHVMAVSPVWRRGTRIYESWNNEDRTNDLGEFCIADLRAGRYYLCATRPEKGPLSGQFKLAGGESEVRIRDTCYPGAASLDAATPITVRPGQEVPGIKLRMPVVASVHVRGVVNASSFLGEAGRLWILLSGRREDRELAGSDSSGGVKPDGSFAIPGVVPGNYYLRVFLRGSVVGGKISLDVPSHDIDGLRVPAVGRLEIKGRIRLEANAQQEASGAKLMLDAADPHDSMTALPASRIGDAAFAFPAVDQGRYVISLSPGESGLYLKSIRYQDKEVGGSEIDFSGGLKGELEVVLASGSARVEGTVTTPAAGLRAVLVSEPLRSDDAGLLSAEVDQVGHFLFRNVPPGRYMAFAAAVFDPDVWRNPGFIKQIASRGAVLEAAENGSHRIQLSVLGEDDLREAIERVEAEDK
jgi:hypothetical protein